MPSLQLINRYAKRTRVWRKLPLGWITCRWTRIPTCFPQTTEMSNLTPIMPQYLISGMGQHQETITLGRAPEGNFFCKVTTEFDVLWKHLILGSQKLNLVSIASDMLKIPQRAWQSNLWIRWWDCDSGSSPRYAFDCYQDLDLDPLSKCNRGPTAVIYESWMHKSGKRSSSWRTLSRLRPAGTGYRTFIESGKAASGLIVAARKVIETCITCIYIVWLETGASYSSKCGRFHRGCLRSWPIFFFGNKVTDQICSISRRKKNPTKQCNTLQGPCCI